MLPWSAFWERNYFARTWPALLPLMTNNFVRGATSGLGLVNLIAGFADLSAIFVTRARSDATLPDGTGGPA